MKVFCYEGDRPDVRNFIDVVNATLGANTFEIVDNDEEGEMFIISNHALPHYAYMNSKSTAEGLRPYITSNKLRDSYCFRTAAKCVEKKKPILGFGVYGSSILTLLNGGLVLQTETRRFSVPAQRVIVTKHGLMQYGSPHETLMYPFLIDPRLFELVGWTYVDEEQPYAGLTWNGEKIPMMQYKDRDEAFYFADEYGLYPESTDSIIPYMVYYPRTKSLAIQFASSCLQIHDSKKADRQMFFKSFESFLQNVTRSTQKNQHAAKSADGNKNS